MSLAIVNSQALYGVQGAPVRVEVHVGAGLPAFYLVGLPDTGVRESRERVRSAILSSGFDFPDGRVTVNLAPADLPKASGRFDLAIALGVLLASGQIQDANGAPPDIRQLVVVGELSLTGAVVAVTAPLAIALGVSRQQPGLGLIMPAQGADQAAWVPNLTVWAVDSLAQLVAQLAGRHPWQQAQPAALPRQTSQAPCLSDVRGQQVARRALEVVASGAHSLLMSGPPGVGKSMLAQRLPGLLPPLSEHQMLEQAAVAALGAASHGNESDGQSVALTDVPPFRAPHHSCSVPALVGGGSHPKPGEISLAHHGVLFLDELPQFQSRVLESLREPLETGLISVARALRTHVFPARFLLVAAMNPCPCGWLGHPHMQCRCTPERLRGYLSRLSGPLLDRIDLHLQLPALKSDWMHEPPGESSRTVRERVLQCRQRQLARQGCENGRLEVAQINQHCRLDDAAQTLLQTAMQRWGWSGRVVHRVLKVARTIADMAGKQTIAKNHLAEAMQYRNMGTQQG